MAKVHKKKKWEWLFFWRGWSKTKTTSSGRRTTKKQDTTHGGWLKVCLPIVGLALLAAALTAGFMKMEEYVQADLQANPPVGPIKLIEPPIWLEQSWIDQLVKTLGGSSFRLEPRTAGYVAKKLAAIPWLYDLRVQTQAHCVEVKAKYRRPLVKIELNNKKYFLDKDCFVFEAIPTTKIAIPRVVDFAHRATPPIGSVLRADDIRAAVELAYILTEMDNRMLTLEKDPFPKPLLDEIESINVANFAGRKDIAQPHIVLNVVGQQTQIFWGAAFGQAARYLEAPEKDKIANLYSYFKDYGYTLQNKVRFIELRQPQSLVPRP